MDADETLTHDISKSIPISYKDLRIDKRRKGSTRIFTGGSPPTRVLDVMHSMQTGTYIPAPTDKNSLYALVCLGIISNANTPTFTERPPNGKIELWLASKVIGQPSVRVTREVLRKNSSATPLEVGNAIEALAKTKLSEATKRRYGSGVTVWVNWIYSLLLSKQI